MNKTVRVFTLIFLLCASVSQGQSKFFDISSPLKLWLLNNEARVFSSLSSDELLINRVSLPFSFMPSEKLSMTKAEEKIWDTHRKIYALLDETQSIYATAKRFGSGRFAIVFKQSRPEIWSLLPLQMVRPGLLNLLAVDYRKAFHATLLKGLKLEIDRDLDLSARLGKAVKKLSDDEYRLLDDYFATFAALFPGDSSIRMLKAFIENGPRNNFAPGMKDLLKPVFTAPVFAEVTILSATTVDPLAELEKLAAFEGGAMADEPTITEVDETGETTTEQPPATLEPPPEGTDDLFKIWD